MQRYYTAIIERSASGFSLFFPDLPGCTSAGASVEDAAHAAREALALHIAGLRADDEPIPDTTPADAIPADPDVTEFARLLVPVELSGRAVRLSITMDEGLVAAIDAVADNRSGFLADAARAALSRQKAA
ncbi:type II toxin-antitoxin system HicB family antitoxin [Sandarakinorhabdus sp.]|uniref:type II toxin-antitoxin system HicB family antitoxin n=1 Tax=Sandarakinorhabdus sp. TaxID=1916663 RepID=UPI003F72D999